MANTLLNISGYSLASSLGIGVSSTLEALQLRRSGLRRCDFEDANLDTWIGRIEGVEQVRLTAALQHFDCRNNRLAQMGLMADGFIDLIEQAKHRYGSSRIGVFMGTSTSGIHQTELAYQHRDPRTQKLPADFLYQYTHNVFSVADFTRQFLGIKGPAMSISTACSSSAKVFASAARFIQTGLCDAAIVGGVDSLCLTTLYGFRSLEVVSNDLCRPWDINRKGINIGEAAGFTLVEKPTQSQTTVALMGYGESSDAYHMSTPHPQGLGAKLAMQQAIERAALNAEQIDYINLHGTATLANDISEDQAVVAVVGKRTPCSSTKGWTGHTLGAAGIVEAIISCLCIEHNFIPGSLNTQQLDPALAAQVTLENKTLTVNHVMTNSFGFGGNNCSLIVGRC